METSMAMGVSKMVGLYKGKSHLEIDDDWGYPYDSGNPHMVFGKKKTRNLFAFLDHFQSTCQAFVSVRSPGLAGDRSFLP